METNEFLPMRHCFPMSGDTLNLLARNEEGKMLLIFNRFMYFNEYIEIFAICWLQSIRKFITVAAQVLVPLLVLSLNKSEMLSVNTLANSIKIK